MTVEFQALSLHDRVLLDFGGDVFEAFIIACSEDEAVFWLYDYTTDEYVTTMFTYEAVVFRASLGRPLITHVWQDGAWFNMVYAFYEEIA